MGKKKKKRKESDGPAGAPEWVVTFTDMISLLVTFFVLMLTFSSMEENDRKLIDGLLTSSRSVIADPLGNTELEDLPADLVSATDMRRGAEQPHSRPSSELPDNMVEMGQTLSEDELAIDLTTLPDGVAIQFDPNCSFAPGSSVPNAALVKSLGELGRVLENYQYMVLIEGFTDTGFQPIAGFPDAASISMARASAAADVMTSASGLSPLMLQVAGLGDERPVADNATPGGRRQNRRVEVRILSLSKTRSARVASERVKNTKFRRREND